MLPAAVRMRASAEFSETVAHGVRCAVAPVVVHLRLPSAALTPGGLAAPDVAAAEVPSLRVGLVVSRSVGNAVVRHRVSRRLRHVLADRIATLPPGSRLVVRALPAAAQAESAALATALDRALTKASGRGVPKPTTVGVAK